MSTPRFYSPDSLIAGEELIVPAEAAHHMIHVLRLETGAPVTLFNGQGGEYLCRISAMTRKQVTVNVEAFVDIDRAASNEIHLGMCVIKRDAMDRVIARATELGLRRLTPLVSEYCTVAKKVIRNRQEHWQQVAIAACEQCGLNLIPEILPAQALPDWLARETVASRLFCEPGGIPLDNHAHPDGAVDLLVGPEGGLSAQEADEAVSAGFSAVSFGERILRAETAPLVAMSVIQDRWGR